MWVVPVERREVGEWLRIGLRIRSGHRSSRGVSISIAGATRDLWVVPVDWRVVGERLMIGLRKAALLIGCKRTSESK